jgi:hypothetical protein
MSIRKGFRFTDGLAALCMAIMLCAAPFAARAETAPAAKKKIVLTQFDVANALHVDDISNIYDGLPMALASRLEASGEFLIVYGGRSIPAGAGEAQREAVTRIAAEAGAQFLISGTVVNAGTRQEKGYLGTSIGASSTRHVEVELAVYDGNSGARLLQRRLYEQAEGEVRVGRDKPFGSSIFLETGFGQALGRLVDLAVGDIRAALEKVPFSANIVRVEGKRIFLDAGGDALLKPGDRLVVYVSEAAPVVGLRGAVLGAMDRAADMVTLTQVQPQFSIGELPEEAAKLGIRAGNLARIDPAEQRILMAKQIAAQQALKAEQEARVEAERVKKEQAAQAEAARARAAQAEAARIKAEKEAKAQADAEAKAAKLKAAQQARATRLSAAQEARAREQAQAARAAARAKREAAKAEKKAQAEAKKQADAEAKAAKLKAAQEARAEAERVRAEKEAQAKAEKEAKAKELAAAQPVAGSGVANADMLAEAAEAPPKKQGVPLKLKQIKP